MPMGCCVRFKLLPVAWKNSAVYLSSAMAVKKYLGGNRVGVHAEASKSESSFHDMASALLFCFPGCNVKVKGKHVKEALWREKHFTC